VTDTANPTAGAPPAPEPAASDAVDPVAVEPPATAPGRLDFLCAWAILATAAALAHGQALFDGLWLDDHLHQKRLRTMGWSFGEMLEAAAIEPQTFIECWWQERPLRWQYSRPAAMYLMKAVHEVTGGSIVAHHAVGLALHLGTACLVHLLCVWLTGSRFWSIVAGLLFVVYSHSVGAVGWLAAQNTVLQTFLTLAALLLYARASGLRLRPDLDSAAGEPAPADVPPMRAGLFAAAIGLYVLSLFVRENAVMFPAFALGFDLAFGGWAHVRRRLPAYIGLAGPTLAFLVWRLGFYYHPIPPIYSRMPDGDGYAGWLLAKFMHYLTSAVWLSPMTVGPTGRFHPLSDAPGDAALMAAILAVMGTGYYQACRRIAGWWLWPMWLFVSILPVANILATPHSGYLCGVGFAVAMVLGPALRKTAGPAGMGRWSPGVAIWFLIATCTYIPIYRTTWNAFRAAERLTIDEISADGAPTTETDLYFINLPFVNVYAGLHLEEEWGRPAAGVRVRVLTYAPNVFRMEPDCRVEELDDHSLAVTLDGDRWFSGLLGRFLVEAMRTGGRPIAGQTFVAPDWAYTVRVADADAQGVRTLVFRFAERLDSPRHRIYLTTRDCPAVRLRFGPDRAGSDAGLAKPAVEPYDFGRAAVRLDEGNAAAGEELLAAAASSDVGVSPRAWRAFAGPALAAAEATGSSMGGILRSEQPTASDIAAVARWWRRSVDDGVLRAAWVRRPRQEAVRFTRNGLFRVVEITASIIQTDLYMTGPPYPGPR
jgi:hypothetical protein